MLVNLLELLTSLWKQTVSDYLVLWWRAQQSQCNILFTTTAPPAPNGVTIVRSNDNTQVTVSWTPSTVVEARSLIRFYRVSYSPAIGGSRKRQSDTTCSQSPCDVPGTESSVLITGLDPAINYNVQVAIVNGGGQQGVSSPPMTVITVEPEGGEHVYMIPSFILYLEL